MKYTKEDALQALEDMDDYSRNWRGVLKTFIEEACAQPVAAQPVEINFEWNGERIYFDGHEEWHLPATYGRLTPIVQELAREWHKLATCTAQMESKDEVLPDILAILDDTQVEYHEQGMGCGLEDRGITDKYDAMRYGWDEAIDRMHMEVVAPAINAIDAAIAASKSNEE